MLKFVFIKLFNIFFLKKLENNQKILKHFLYLHDALQTQIQFTLLLQLCDPVARLCPIFRTCVRKANLFSYTLRIHTVFVWRGCQRERLKKRTSRSQSTTNETTGAMLNQSRVEQAFLRVLGSKADKPANKYI